MSSKDALCGRLMDIMRQPPSQTSCSTGTHDVPMIKGNLVEPTMMDLGWLRTGGNDHTRMCRGSPCWKCRDRVEIEAFVLKACLMYGSRQFIEKDLELESKLLQRELNLGTREDRLVEGKRKHTKKELATIHQKQMKQDAIFRKIDSLYPYDAAASFPELDEQHEELEERHDKLTADLARTDTLQHKIKLVQSTHKHEKH